MYFEKGFDNKLVLNIASFQITEETLNYDNLLFLQLASN